MQHWRWREETEARKAKDAVESSDDTVRAARHQSNTLGRGSVCERQRKSKVMVCGRLPVCVRAHVRKW